MDRYDFRTQRLFTTHDLAHGVKIEADRAQANYLLNVLRMKDGARVLLFNGRDGEWLAHVRPNGRKACVLEIAEQTRPQPQPCSLIYCFAPLKQARLDYLVQKAVEMGAGRLQPVITQHTQSGNIKTERMQANAIEAAEQCGILPIPEISEPVKLQQLPDVLPENCHLVFCDEAANNADAVSLLEPLKGRQIAVLIGPEGGFSDEEREFLRDLPNVTIIPLGPRILRADTAAVAALALVQAVAGDWAPAKKL